MGKVAGNLNTELIVDFLVRKMHYDYEFDDILDIIDDYIYKYSLCNKWGYSIPGMMAGIYKSHPNNIIYLTEKFRLETKDISKLLSMIEPAVRQTYDYDNIKKLYVEYISEKVDDRDVIISLKENIEDKSVLVLVPGNSIVAYDSKIKKYIADNNPVIISVNYVSDFDGSYSFFGNKKRYNKVKDKIPGQCIVTSNISTINDNVMVVNYHGLINREYFYFENSTIMLLNLLKKISPKSIAIAGFDGFESNKAENYMDKSFQNDRHKEEFDNLNKEIKMMFTEFKNIMKDKCSIELITPSLYS